MGIACDITNPRDVEKLISKLKPDVLILSAGNFVPLVPVGEIRNWSAVRDFVQARAFGPIVAANALMKLRKKRRRFFIALAGRDTSASPKLMPYTVGNGGLWAAVRFLAKHTGIYAAYIDLPPITGTAMVKRFERVITSKELTDLKKKSEPVSVVIRAVESILSGRRANGTRTVLGGKGSL